MARILILPQVFPPEIHPTAVMTRELAVHLAAHRWDVDVVCGYPHHPRGVLPEGWSKSLWRTESFDGVKVFRPWHFTHPSRTVPIRLAVYFSQTLSALLGALVRPRADIVLVVGPPLIGGSLGFFAGLRHRAGLVNVIYDLYPDVAVETGKLRNPVGIALAKLAEQFQYRAARLTVVLSEGFKRALRRRGVPANKLAVIPVWLDPDEIRPLPHDNAWRREQGIAPDTFVVLYAGTIGVVSGATVVAEAAALLRERTDILFLFVGEGEAKVWVESKARTDGLRNLRCLPFQPRPRLAEVQAAADAGLVTLAPGRGRTSVPSKVLGYLAAGRPVIASVDPDSDTAAAVTQGLFGLVVPPADAGALAAAVEQLSRDRKAAESYGKAARRYFELEFARGPVLERYRQALEKAVRKRRRGSVGK